MSSSAGVLTMLTRPALRDEVDRVAAAVGIRVVHLPCAEPVSRKTWTAAAAVLLDEEAAVRCGHGRLPRRPHVAVLSTVEPTGTTWRAAITIGACQVLTLPGDANDLVRQLAEAGEAAGDGERKKVRGGVLAVIGGRGGAGASLLAAALAQSAHDALLVDLDPFAGGIDLVIGSENTPGLRWPDLGLQSGRLTWLAVRNALPRQRGVSVLSGTRCGYELDARTVDAVVDAGRRGGATVICDLPRGLTEAAETVLETADLVVLITSCDVRAGAAGAAIAPRLRSLNPTIGLVVRGPAPGGLRAADIADIIGLPLLASMRAEPRLAEGLEHGGLRLPPRSALAAAARRVLAVLPSRPGAAATTAAAA